MTLKNCFNFLEPIDINHGGRGFEQKCGSRHELCDQNAMIDVIGPMLWLFLTLLVGFVSVLWARQVWRAHDSRNWPPTEGVVFAFYETPCYRYTVAGQTYTNSFASCNELFNRIVSIQNSEKYAVRYPLEAKVPVHYSRNKPSLAVLETKFDSLGIYLVCGLALINLMFIVGFVFGGRIPGRNTFL